MKTEYRNVFLELGYTEDEIEKRVESTYFEIFHGENKFYYETDDKSMGYLVDTGNNDTRTEGISYGMMMSVQLNKKKEFDQLWTWARTKMYMEEGYNAGYFAWSVLSNGEKNSDGPAPDGEEFFAMSLIFASHRWGDGEGIYEYSREARELLRTCIHKHEIDGGDDMWEPDNHLIKFVPGLDFTDPSYHIPHFYELFAENCYEEDRDYWLEAASCSREYLKKACHPDTGLSAEYSYYDGTPYEKTEIFGRHDWYYSDAYRTITNIALDYQWSSYQTSHGDWCRKTADSFLKFFDKQQGEDATGIFLTDGTRVAGQALHPVAMIATSAFAGLAAEDSLAHKAADKFWNTPLRTGERRYYDNCLYMFAMLALSGNYRIW